MRLSRGIVIVAGYIVLSVGPGLAQTLGGWGGFLFGMGPDRARHVPGYEFGGYSRKNLLDQNQGAMASKKPVLIDGVPYNFDLWFNAFEALDRIALQNETTTTRGECETRFLALLSNSEKSYGAFAPLYAERKKNDQDAMPLTIEWKNSQNKSHYQLATAYLGVETASVWEARKDYGDRYVDTAAIWSAGQDDAKAVCLMELDYKIGA